MLEEERIKLSKGCVLSMWFHLETIPSEINANQCDLFQINLTKNYKIQFSLIMDKLIISKFILIQKTSYNMTAYTSFQKVGKILL
jgi:hypothetical protein